MKSQILPMEHESLVSEHEKASGPARVLTQPGSTRPSTAKSAGVQIRLVRCIYPFRECAYVFAAASQNFHKVTEMRTLV